jgi:glycine/D-amino acid oxidase-like deaminating enzyme
VSSVRTDDAVLSADDVVLACGIWGPAVAALAGVALPLTPVAHPYVHGPARSLAASRSPFVRWPEHHVYACDHGDRLGLGTYDHVPVPVAVDGVGSAQQPWSERFEGAVQRALALLPEASRFAVDTRLNGVFAMTADNLPLLGPVDAVAGLWAAEALWVTHAAGAARALAQTMTERTRQLRCRGLGGPAPQPLRWTGRTSAHRPSPLPVQRHLRHALTTATSSQPLSGQTDRRVSSPEAPGEAPGRGVLGRWRRPVNHRSPTLTARSAPAGVGAGTETR